MVKHYSHIRTEAKRRAVGALSKAALPAAGEVWIRHRLKRRVQRLWYKIRTSQKKERSERSASD
jgi:hypothetical protein